jgi:hypothetical protein
MRALVWAGPNKGHGVGGGWCAGADAGHGLVCVSVSGGVGFMCNRGWRTTADHAGSGRVAVRARGLCGSVGWLGREGRCGKAEVCAGQLVLSCSRRQVVRAQCAP